MCLTVGLKTCVICNEAKENGIVILDSFICGNCENEIINTSTDDAQYKVYIEKLRCLTEIKQEITF